MSPIRLSKLESATRAVLAFCEAINRHDIPGIMQLISDDCIYEDYTPAPDGAVYSGKAEISLYFHDFFRLSPHIHIEIEEIFGLGYRCVLRWKYEWVDDTGEKAYLRGVDIFKLQEGFICERLSYVKAS
ncbi:MAG: nuclear transport factor 2 family protein [Anaerolineales bacterium]|nr:nuclear transport factor 2 family protein [Anaerolineales bacterium]